MALELGLSPAPPAEPLSYTQPASFVSRSGRLDSQYFMPAKTATIAALAGHSTALRLGDAFESVRDIVDPKKNSISRPSAELRCHPCFGAGSQR